MKSPIQLYQPRQMVSCYREFEYELVVICDVQRRVTGYAYLVINTQGLLYVAWAKRTQHLGTMFELRQLGRLPAHQNPNIDTAAFSFRFPSYIIP